MTTIADLSRFSNKGAKAFPVAAVALLFFLLIFPCHIPEAGAASLTLAWNPSPSPVAGYKVYYGTASHVYSHTITLDNRTDCDIPDLANERTYYFTVSAYDEKTESALAEEIAYTVPANRPPVAREGTLDTAENTTAAGILPAGDPDGDALEFFIAARPMFGKVVITDKAKGTYKYIPAQNMSGTDSFAFRAGDGTLKSRKAAISVTVNPKSGHPVAVDDFATVSNGSTARIYVLSNDKDASQVSLALASQPSGGTAAVAGKSVFYTPRASFSGTDECIYSIATATGCVSTAKITIKVLATNRAPVAHNLKFETVRDHPVAKALKASDADKDPLTYFLTGAPSGGSVELVRKGRKYFRFTPPKGFTGAKTFRYKASDGALDSNEAKVTVVVKPAATITIEAESAADASALVSPFRVGASAAASGKKFIWVPPASSGISDPAHDGGSASYVFSVPVSGKYYLWGRQYSSIPAHNSFFVSIDSGQWVPWNTPLSGKWVYGRLRDADLSRPLSLTLSRGEHFLHIKQKESGAKLDTLVLTNLRDYVPETICYCGRLGAGTWTPSGSASPEAAALSVYDDARQSTVIQFSGNGTRDKYLLNGPGDWQKSSRFVLEWAMKFKENYVVEVRVATLFGNRIIRYTPDAAGTIDASVINMGIGTKTKNGEWLTVIRDLNADLASLEAGNSLREVNGFSVRGNGRIDDVRLRDF